MKHAHANVHPAEVNAAEPTEPVQKSRVLRIDDAARKAAAKAIAQGGEADPKDFVRPRPVGK